MKQKAKPFPNSFQQNFMHKKLFQSKVKKQVESIFSRNLLELKKIKVFIISNKKKMFLLKIE